MRKRAAILAFLVSATLVSGRDKSQTWLQVSTPHFMVVTNAGEKTGRHIADQFERMRTVFNVAFPHLASDKESPIIVIAIKDEKDFRALEPEVYLAKGQIKLGGLFLAAPDKNYVLMRVDAEGAHPYSVIYHEYTHFLLRKSAEWLPLWLNEGLAEFYENTDIHEKDVALGQSDPQNLQLLRESRLLPLASLFAVDRNSPYYHEENKASIFYAESWALTHYLAIKDLREGTHHVNDYMELLAKNVDTATAATSAFGDLRQLQSNLMGYIRAGSLGYLKLLAMTDVDDTTFKVQSLTEVQGDARRADFLAYDGRLADSRSLLDHVLQEDPQNVSAHETMGFLEFRAGHLEEAQKWYEQAVKLDSQSYLAHYYYAAISMNEAIPVDDSQVEASLRAAIKLNPTFAPAFDRLAAFEGMLRQNLEEAHMMSLTAVELDPANVGYRITAANLLMQLQRSEDAVNVLHIALRMAKTPVETATVQSFLTQVEQYTNARQHAMQQNRRSTSEQKGNAPANPDAVETADADVEAPDVEAPEEVPKGPHHFLSGTLHDVQCHAQKIDMAIAVQGNTMPLHSGNYYKIQFTALGFTPQGELNPCKDLEGKSAKVDYIESSDPSTVHYVVAIEIHR
jgi:tetratricopeptide (TPR) repeat protein